MEAIALSILTNEQVVTWIFGLISVGASWLLLQIRTAIREKTRFEVSDRQWAKIHSALMTGLKQAAAKRHLHVDLDSAEQRAAMIQDAVGWTIGPGASDSVRNVGVNGEQLATLAESKIDEALALIRR